jgi:hypothetical protein
MEMLGPLSLFVLIPLGLALLWSVRLLYAARGPVDDPLRLILNIAGWTLTIVGIIGTVTLFLVLQLGAFAWVCLGRVPMGHQEIHRPICSRIRSKYIEGP